MDHGLGVEDLGISEGDPLEVDYYVWHEEGQLMTRTARFRLAGVLSTAGDVDTRSFPRFRNYRGAKPQRLGSAVSLDLRRIRPEDETYWNRYRTTPKAFLTLARGQELWANRFGKLTGLRIRPPDGMSPEKGRRQFEQACSRTWTSIRRVSS